MIKFTCQSPHLRANKIKQGIDILSYRDNEYLKQFGLAVASDMVVVSDPYTLYHKIMFFNSNQYKYFLL